MLKLFDWCAIGLSALGGVLLAGALVFSGCSTAPALVEAMAKDPATVCASVAGPYPVSIARTNLKKGKVQCSPSGMTVESAE